MSLFPAYAPDGDEMKTFNESDTTNRCNVQLELKDGGAAGAVAVQTAAALALEEAALLASDSSEEDAPPPASHQPLPDIDFYFDGRADNANLGVTTLYYPGRPIYTRAAHALGGAGRDAGAARGAGRGAWRRYYLQPAAPAEPSAREVAARALAYRQMLAASPRDEDLWLAFLRFQEDWGEGAAWLAACEEAVRCMGRGRGGAAAGGCGGELHRARRAHCAPQDLLKAITGDIHDEKCSWRRLEHWLRLLWTLSCGAGAGAGAGGAAGEVQRAAHAALQDVPLEPRAYPLALYVYGSALRAAGLWEQLVLLLELVCAVNYPRCAAFPPAAPAAEEARARDQRLQRAEDTVISSGLPLSTVWVRVERLRAAAHWRAAAAGAEADADVDPQRAPAAAEVAPMLRAVRPAATLLMCVCMLRLAQVPLLPMSAATQRACGAGDAEEGDGLGAALPALYRAARRVSHAAARPAALRRALHHLLDPPHCFSDEAGYLSWTAALWDACCGWMEGRRRLALACWRLRWLHALVLLAPPDEARRLRAQARRVLKLHAPAEPVAFALFARLEADLGEAESARRAALQAVRVSCGAERTERCEALFAARVLREVVGMREPALCRTALCCAVTQRALPPALENVPSEPELLAEALHECSKRCDALERGFDAEAARASEPDAEAARASEPDAVAARALVCGAGEWAAARVALLAPAARSDALAALLARPRAALHGSPDAAHYYEASACALALAGCGRATRALAQLFPGSALLALAAEAAPLWARGGSEGGAMPAPRGRLAALARALPPLLRAPLDADAEPAELSRLARVLSRAEGPDAALEALRLEVEARAPLAAPHATPHAAHRALLAALAAHPNHKMSLRWIGFTQQQGVLQWAYVRGAAWVPAEADALCDAALERGLRLHALTHELRPPPTSAPSTIYARYTQ